MTSVSVGTKAPLVPYGLLIAAKYANVDFEVNDFDKVVYNGAEGYEAAVKKLIEDHPEVYLGDKSKISDEWLLPAMNEYLVKDFKKLNPALEKLESHLHFRSYMVGYSLSLADILVWGALRANPLMGSIIKSGTFINISRWYNFLALTFNDTVDAYLAAVNKAKAATSTGKKAHSANYGIELIGAEDGKVVTRFPPEPSGYLHIGHAKAAILNQHIAQMYHGKMIIRFDDTNPSKENLEFQQSIIEDLELLGIKAERTTFSSDYFDTMYDLAEKLISEDKAYADDTPQERMRAERMDGIPSSRRNRPVQESLDIFENEMKNGTEIGLTYCIRAKISPDDPNKALRDPVIYRCNLTPHHRTGTTWKMYPTYDFCVPVVDAIEGVTHALRTIEYRDRNAQYDWMLNALNLRKVHIWDFSRLNFVRTLLSKRKLQWFVNEGLVTGWDDPRFPTVRGVRRRGMTVEGLWAFIIAQGPSKNIINLDWNLIWATNKKVIDPIAPRHVAVAAENPVVVTLAGAPEKPYTEKRPRHKKNPEVGEKDVIFAPSVLIDQADGQSFAEGEEVTLMDWGNVIVNKINKDDRGSVTDIDATLHLDGDFRKTKKKVTWIANTDDVVKADLVDFDLLITKDKLEENDKVEDYLTPQTEFHSSAIADSSVKTLKEGDIIQFERKGYYRLDKAPTATSPAVFFTIPDGKSVQRYGVKPE
ncbi:hypothetical protein CANCADRAFT_44829 [Tortispora caseinolytica NRRL Y-17796]|uniref:glutamate--tRNA ligase n=1 Tax=Tortispora caseinolytica NRRL Y-17796 TaxID=767744 RepID=A0A1E4THI3_9ASCO|nr:hypothetical protein CANCADRAFT_44829 [Tortispora caseinolytica NRRL Y-17796]